jgi:anti-anti-sigma factor
VADHRAQAGALMVPPVVTLPAQIDVTNAGMVSDQLRAAFGPGVTVVVADMTLTTFCDSCGVRSLVLASNEAADSHAGLRLAIGSARVLRTLQVLGLARVFSIYRSVDDALADRAAPEP